MSLCNGTLSEESYPRSGIEGSRYMPRFVGKTEEMTAISQVAFVGAESTGIVSSILGEEDSCLCNWPSRSNSPILSFKSNFKNTGPFIVRFHRGTLKPPSILQPEKKSVKGMHTPAAVK